jgi:hypothetical protein
MRNNLKLKPQRSLALSLGLALCIFSFAFSARGEDHGVTFHYRPENIANGYHVVSLIENNGVKERKDQLFDLPIVRAPEISKMGGAAGTPEIWDTGTAFVTDETMDIAAIMVRGLPIHMPGTAVAANAAWDGWSEAGQMIVHHIYTFGGIKDVAGRRCAEVNYKLQALQRTPDGSAAQDQNIVTGDGRFLFDLNNGVIVVHTWQMNGGGLKADYAAVLNI